MKHSDESCSFPLVALESERRRLGEILHDTISATLTAATLLLERIDRAVATGKPVTREALDQLRDAIETAVTQARSLSRRFNPPMLEGGGFVSALHLLASETPHCEFICEKPVFPHSSEHALALYRIAEYALDLAGQDPEANTSGSMQLRVERKRDGIVLSVQSAAVAPAGSSESIGFMRSYASAVGGEFEVRKGERGGMIMVCNLPFSSRETAS